jgi:hypothetical protein
MTENPITDLEAELVQAAERHFAVAPAPKSSGSSSRRRVRLRASVLAVGAAAVIAVPALAATRVIDLHTGGPVTPRIEVATGSTPQTGRWKIVHSRDAKDAACVGLQLLDEAQPGESPVLYEGCGGPSDLNVASLSGPDRSIIYGRVPPNTAVVELTAPGGVVRRITPTAAQAVDASKFFLAVLPAGERSIVVTAKDRAGESVAKQAIPTTDNIR